MIFFCRKHEMCSLIYYYFSIYRTTFVYKKAHFVKCYQYIYYQNIINAKDLFLVLH